ncbi:hypothetical protein [uncultured Microbacterium sp.]|uniref:hypothetical protein n=1 Tax=uncultured Microbacterium sp. TaxID=191216 RepID=UPI0028DCF22A|nr:hypothetical protein [uncultured Microbacterium sp.]
MTGVNPWAEIIGPCYRSTSLARALGWTDEQVVEAAAALQILELLTDDGVLLYPAFQVHDGRVLEGLAEVLRVLSSGTSGRWTWAQWLNASVDDDSGEEAPSAIEQLRAGQLDDVMRDAKHVAWAWSN